MPPIHSPAAAPHPPAAARWAVLRSEAGITLIEVLVTSLIVVLLAAATATALISTTHASGDQRERSQADAIASQDQDRLRGLSAAQLNGLHQTRSETVGGRRFSVTSRARYLDSTAAAACASSSVASYTTTSTVSWRESFTSHPKTSVRVSSLLSHPVGDGLLVQVSDQTGQRLSGVLVRAVGPVSQTGTTDRKGCVLFTGLTPGSYTATTSIPGYVDPNGSSAPAATAKATVTATGLRVASPQPIDLGQAGSISATFTTSTANVAAEADGIAWSGSGTTSAGMTGGFATRSSAPSVPVKGLITGSLYPFYRSVGTVGYTNNYVVWGGRCAGQQPPTAYSSASVHPGETGLAVNVQEPLLSVAATSVVGLGAVKPTDVKMTFTSGGCTDVWYPALTTATTMPATGWLQDPGQPYAPSGTLTVCADYASASTFDKGTATTGNTSFATSNPVPAIVMRPTAATSRC